MSAALRTALSWPMTAARRAGSASGDPARGSPGPAKGCCAARNAATTAPARTRAGMSRSRASIIAARISARLSPSASNASCRASFVPLSRLELRAAGQLRHDRPGGDEAVGEQRARHADHLHAGGADQPVRQVGRIAGQPDHRVVHPTALRSVGLPPAGAPTELAGDDVEVVHVLIGRRRGQRGASVTISATRETSSPAAPADAGTRRPR